MLKIAPSVLASDFARLGEEAAAMERAGADLLHLDVMDGHFVPNLSFGPTLVASLRRAVDMPFDVHLMISRPLDYVEPFAKAGADLITFHLESESPVAETLDAIRSHGAVPGVVLKPATPAEAAFPWLDRVGMVLVMTVEPGFGGQKFMTDMLPKITALRERIDALGLAVDLEVDGGIDERTAPLAAGAGANVLVAGSSLFRQNDYAAAVRSLREAALGGHS